MKFIGKIIWDFSEFFHIPLGNFAPIVFEWMIGRKGKKLPVASELNCGKEKCTCYNLEDAWNCTKNCENPIW